MNGLDLIKTFEGCKLEAYQDSVGIWTIGYGETKNVHKGMKITQKEADDMLLNRYKEFEVEVLKLVKPALNPNQLGALVSFSYNLGVGSLKSSKLLKYININDFNKASDEFLKWNKAGGKVLNGLTKRREAERKLFNAII